MYVDSGTMPSKVRIRLPGAHEHQRVFTDWPEMYPEAQVLVGPAGTKSGKTMGASLWLTTEALTYKGLYCAWVAPTYQKCQIAYRYIKAMVNIDGLARCVDGKLEIRLANGSFIKFMHGRDAEVTVEGEAIDRFVLDEAGKIVRQVWHSLFTTITQTMGLGIITGTPRGFNWYYDVFRLAKSGDPFFCWAQLQTDCSPFVRPEAIANAKRLLPKHLFDQYYKAIFTSYGSTFGDLSGVWDESLQVPEGNVRFWIHPNESLRSGSIIHGVDVAKKQDYTVFYSVATNGMCVGFCRFRHVKYQLQAFRLERYLKTYFDGDHILRYDATGVGEAFGEYLADFDLDVAITPITFTNKLKGEMVTRATMALEDGWHRAPRIEVLEHELASYELSVTKTGNHTYSAPEGEHDDCVTALMLALSTAYQSAKAEEAEKLLEAAMQGKDITEVTEDPVAEYARVAGGSEDEDGFFDNETVEELDFDQDNN